MKNEENIWKSLIDKNWKKKNLIIIFDEKIGKIFLKIEKTLKEIGEKLKKRKI
jgi:hypothetical protein